MSLENNTKDSITSNGAVIILWGDNIAIPEYDPYLVDKERELLKEIQDFEDYNFIQFF